jgi:ABC-type ATPase involved in cell division
VIRAVILGLPEKGTTVILTTHDPDLPGRMEGELIRLEDGRLSAGPEAPAGGGPDRKNGANTHDHV